MTTTPLLTNGHTVACLASAQSDAVENLHDQGSELTPTAILVEALDYLETGLKSCTCTNPTDADVLELARLGLAFQHQTTFIHFLLACGRRDDPLMEAAQAEQYALSTRISEVKERMTEEQGKFLHMGRLTSAHAPIKRLSLIKIAEEV